VVAQHLPLLLAGHKSLQNEPPPAKVWLGTCRVAVLKPQRHFGSVQPTCYCIVVQAMPPHKQEDDYNGGSFLLVLRNGHLQIRSHKNRLNKGNATWLDSRLQKASLTANLKNTCYWPSLRKALSGMKRTLDPSCLR
jgi:hypothetical protein